MSDNECSDELLEDLISRLSLNTKEKRILLLLSNLQQPVDIDKLNKLYFSYYPKDKKLPITSVINRLKENNLIIIRRNVSGELYNFDRNLLICAVEEKNLRDFRQGLDLVRDARRKTKKQAVYTYYGKDEVITGFEEMEQTILQKGGIMYDMRDILPFVADTENKLRKRHSDLIEKGLNDIVTYDCQRLKRRHEMLKSGALRMTIVMDRLQTEEALDSWRNHWGYDYISSRLSKFIELLELDSFLVVFSKERIDLKVEIIENYCAALYWRSFPRGQTDRLIVFWDPLIISGHTQYFWLSYYKAIEGRDPKTAKSEVRSWAQAQIF